MQLLALLAVTTMVGQAPALGVLAGKVPTTPGLQAPERMTDGLIAHDGDPWDTSLAVRLPPGVVVEWDLGRDQPLAGAAIQGDNNDLYTLSLSADGQTWADVFRAEPKPTPGLQTRVGEFVTHGRYVRLRAEGGDAAYSVAEVALFADGASMATSALVRPPWVPSHPLDLSWTYLLLATGLALFLTSSRSPSFWVGVCGLGLLAVGASVLGETNATPSDAARVNWIRAVVALLAATAVLREALFQRRYPAHRGLVQLVYAATAVLGVWSFLNLGRPQFFDAGRGTPTFLHHYDMRTYYPLARYFAELRFDGVYEASARVVADERGEAAVAGVPLRSLLTHEMTTYGASKAHADEVRARFSDARWASFVQDMTYFRRGMGDGGYLGSMQDHGGNATPVWLLGARLLLGWFDAGDGTLWLGVAVDALLVLLAFAALGWAFGWRTAMVTACVFGAMDFYMFGSNWFGAALRHDWLALWLLGIAAVKKEKFEVGGALLAWAALIRAFPALGLVTLSAPLLWDLGRSLWQQKKAFDRQAFLARHRAEWRVYKGVALWGGFLFTVSTLMFGPRAWVEWLRKVAILNRDGHVNNLAVKTWLVQDPTAWLVVAVLATAVVLFVSRKLPLSVAAAMGVVLLPVVFNPANYYLHVVCGLAVLAREDEARGRARGFVAFLVLLGMCAASFFTSLSGDFGAHFYADTLVLMVALGVLVVWQGIESFLPEPVEPEAPANP